jgi:4-hydroxy-4-methyl-2-oxoglutarate aldolase
MSEPGTDRRAALASLSTSEISDAMDRLRISGQCFGIYPQTTSAGIVGQAWTLRYGPVGVRAGTVGDYIDDISSDEVVVLDNQGRTDATVWGDLLTLTAARNRIAGTVIDGVCRDIGRADELGYPVYARGRWMRTGKDRVQVESTGVPVTLGGVRVAPGDWLRGDADGIVVVPVERADEIIAAAQTIQRAESAIRAAVHAGHPLRDARAQAGYHTLQTAPARP